MYAKCGALTKAQEVFDELPIRNVCIWNALSSGYAQQGMGNEALDCYCKMRSEGFSPDAITYACTLKACGITKEVEFGEQVHDEIVCHGLLGKDVLGNALVNMYAKCGMLTEARQVLDKLPVRNVVSWSAMIAGYIQQGQSKEAIVCYNQMQDEGLSPDAITYTYIFKACGSGKEVDKGKQIHEEVASQGLLGKDVVLGTALVDMYAKCGLLSKARQVLDKLPVRNAVTWNALIAGYAQQGQNDKAMVCYDQMQHEGLSPDATTYACILKACGIAELSDKGRKIHEEVVDQGLLRNDTVLGNALVDMYAKCGMLNEAQKVLEELLVRDVVSWNALIAGYAQKGQSEKAMVCYNQMRQEGLSPDAVTYACMLKACSIAKEVGKGKQIHGGVASQGLLGTDVVLGNALVDMYANCGILTEAQQMLDELPIRDTISWSALIAGYTEQGKGKEAIDCYEQLRHEGLSPSAITYACILKACGIAKEINKGKQIHEEIASQGLLEKDAILGNALVDMYTNCGLLPDAWQVLYELPLWDTVSWLALIAGYIQQGQGKEAINCYEQMRRKGLSPNRITYRYILKACAIANEVDKGKQIHKDIAKERLWDKDVVLGNALVDMYANCGLLSKAQELLERLPVRDAASWTVLITGYVQERQSQKAMACYQQMRCEGVYPNATTYACILKAYGIGKDVDKGKEIHEDIVSQGLLGKNAILGNALVDMYAKCGVLTKARQVLEELPVRDIISWSSLIAGYAQEGWAEEAKECFELMQSEGIFPNTVSWNTIIGGYAHRGESEKALGCFCQMQHEGLSPDATTLVCVLNACSHSGLVDEGQMFFKDFGAEFGITPNIEHHACMVDLFGRAGHFDKAMAIIEMLPPCNFLAVWSALMGACWKWGNVKLGRLAFEHAMELDEHDAPAYVCMNSIYAAAGIQEDAQEIESMRMKDASWKLSSLRMEFVA